MMRVSLWIQFWVRRLACAALVTATAPLTAQTMAPGADGQAQETPLQPLPHAELPEPPLPPEVMPVWIWLVGGVMVAALLALVVWLLLRPKQPGIFRGPDPRTQALRSLRALRESAAALAPAQVGQETSAILRTYLQQRYRIPARARTSPELFSTRPAATTLAPPPLPSPGLIRSCGLFELRSNRPDLGLPAPVTMFAPLAVVWDKLAFAPVPATTDEALQLVDEALRRMEEDAA